MKSLNTKQVTWATIHNTYEELNKSIRVHAKAITRLEPQLASLFVSQDHHVPEKFNKHLSIIDGLYNKSILLDNIAQDIRLGFSEDEKRVASIMSKIINLKQYAHKKSCQALDIMKGYCAKSQPPFYSLLVERTSKSLAACKLEYSDVEQFSLARRINDTDGNLKGSQYGNYFRFNNVVDKSGFTHPSLYVVVTCTIDKYGRFMMRLSIQLEFKVLGRFKGKYDVSSPKQIAELLRKELAALNLTEEAKHE